MDDPTNEINHLNNLINTEDVFKKTIYLNKDDVYSDIFRENVIFQSFSDLFFNDFKIIEFKECAYIINDYLFKNTFVDSYIIYDVLIKGYSLTNDPVIQLYIYYNLVYLHVVFKINVVNYFFDKSISTNETYTHTNKKKCIGKYDNIQLNTEETYKYQSIPEFKNRLKEICNNLQNVKDSNKQNEFNSFKDKLLTFNEDHIFKNSKLNIYITKIFKKHIETVNTDITVKNLYMRICDLKTKINEIIDNYFPIDIRKQFKKHHTFGGKKKSRRYRTKKNRKRKTRRV